MHLEIANLNIVGVSANPFDMGIEHWLSNINEFKKLYNISIEYTEEGLIVDKYKLEQRFLKEFKQYKYTPMEKFTGYTECLSINPILKYYEWYNENIKINEYKF